MAAWIVHFTALQREKTWKMNAEINLIFFMLDLPSQVTSGVLTLDIGPYISFILMSVWIRLTGSIQSVQPCGIIAGSAPSQCCQLPVLPVLPNWNVGNSLSTLVLWIVTFILLPFPSGIRSNHRPRGQDPEKQRKGQEEQRAARCTRTLLHARMCGSVQACSLQRNMWWFGVAVVNVSHKYAVAQRGHQRYISLGCCLEVVK